MTPLQVFFYEFSKLLQNSHFLEYSWVTTSVDNISRRQRLLPNDRWQMTDAQWQMKKAQSFIKILEISNSQSLERYMGAIHYLCSKLRVKTPKWSYYSEVSSLIQIHLKFFLFTFLSMCRYRTSLRYNKKVNVEMHSLFQILKYLISNVPMIQKQISCEELCLMLLSITSSPSKHPSFV